MTYSQVSDQLTQINNNTSQIRYQQGRENLGKQEIDKNAFLQLMLAQLQHQDPMEPMDNEQFLQQQASFTQIEKLDAINKNLTISNTLAQAGSMVGKTVEVKGDDGQTVTGKVDSAVIDTTGVKLKIGGKTYSPEQVTQIFGQTAAAAS